MHLVLAVWSLSFWSTGNLCLDDRPCPLLLAAKGQRPWVTRQKGSWHLEKTKYYWQEMRFHDNVSTEALSLNHKCAMGIILYNTTHSKHCLHLGMLGKTELKLWSTEWTWAVGGVFRDLFPLFAALPFTPTGYFFYKRLQLLASTRVSSSICPISVRPYCKD